MSERLDPLLVHADGSAVFHRELDRGYPLIERGEGMWLVERKLRQMYLHCEILECSIMHPGMAQPSRRSTSGGDACAGR